MKITDISIYMFCVLAVMGFLSGALGGGYSFTLTDDSTFDGNAIIESLNPLDATMGYYDYYAYEGTGIMFNGLSGLIGLLKMPLNLGGFLQDIFPIIPNELVAIITGLSWIVYTVGIVQWVSNKPDGNYK